MFGTRHTPQGCFGFNTFHSRHGGDLPKNPRVSLGSNLSRDEHDKGRQRFLLSVIGEDEGLQPFLDGGVVRGPSCRREAEPTNNHIPNAEAVTASEE